MTHWNLLAGPMGLWALSRLGAEWCVSDILVIIHGWPAERKVVEYLTLSPGAWRYAASERIKPLPQNTRVWDALVKLSEVPPAAAYKVEWLKRWMLLGKVSMFVGAALIVLLLLIDGRWRHFLGLPS